MPVNIRIMLAGSGTTCAETDVVEVKTSFAGEDELAAPRLIVVVLVSVYGIAYVGRPDVAVATLGRPMWCRTTSRATSASSG